MGFGFMISATCLPIPLTPMVIAAGAILQQYGFLEIELFLWAFVGVVIGDSLSYLLGRLALQPIQRLSYRFLQPMWDKVNTWFTQNGGNATFFSRWLMNSVDVPISMVAGGTKFPYKQFIKNVAVGRAIWLLVYGGLGFALGTQWQKFTEDMQAYQNWTVGIVLIVIAFYALLNRLRKTLLPSFPEA
jgi:membrane protein DedA with SNARE-associated domain